MDETEIYRMEQFIRERNQSGNMINIDSVVILKGGRLAYSRFWYGWSLEKPHETASVGKSIASVLIGRALQQGAMESIDTPLIEYFPEYRGSTSLAGEDEWDPRKDRITLRHVLTMSAGVENWNFYQDGLLGLSEAELVLNRPFAFAPGSRFQYSSEWSHLLAEILFRATGEPVDVYAARELFEPLGIDPAGVTWNRDSAGRATHMGGLSMSAADLAVIGQLCLQDGMWKGRRLLPADWTREAGRAHFPTGTGEYGYGYQFWTDRDGIYFGAGVGGNFLIIDPSRELVVVINARNMSGYFMPYEQVFRQYILPSFQPAGESSPAG